MMSLMVSLPPCSMFLMLSDAISGLYEMSKKGVVHRDISHGNILCTGMPAPNRGVLIDFELAVEKETHRPLADDPRTVSRPARCLHFLLT
jgi:serine/threonine protein kinase